MTIVGKILVFINLVFSLVVGFFVLQVHATSLRWEVESKKLKKELDIRSASENAYKVQNQLLLNDKAEFARKLQQQGVKETDSFAAVVSNLYDQVNQYKADIEARDKRMTQISDSFREKDAEAKRLKEVVKATQEEVKRRQDDYEKLRTTLFDLQKDLAAKVAAKNNAERSEAQARIERKNALDRASQLETENRKLAEDLIRITANNKSQGATAAISPNGKNPPTTRVEGKVTKVEDSLIMLNVGSDRGLKEGHTLEVFRLSSTPGGSLYLGTLRIMKVDPYESVGQMMSKPANQVRVGDEVAPTTSYR
jgi:hypothetical protein